MSAVGYEWMMRAYTVKMQLPMVLMTRSLKTEVISMDTRTSKDPRYPTASISMWVFISSLLPDR